MKLNGLKNFTTIIVIAILLISVVGLIQFLSMGKEEDMDKMDKNDIPDIDKSIPDNVQTATFSLGCFWGPDAKFGVLDGVVRTRVGYAGGEKDNPTYHSLGNHTETIQIDYDPDNITYKDLLNIFWKNHKPTVRRSTQYMSRIFYHNDHQERTTKESKDELEEELGKEIKTVISKFERFYHAEDYHQKYYLKHHQRFLTVYKTIYPDHEDFLNSTAVSRANGYAVGEGYLESPDDLEGMGLNEEGREALFKDWKDAQNYYGESCSTPYI
ncbi:MAG: peptide-methionine (S)-S-oxide reductase MsrA [Thermoplasmatota archaeon]